MAGPKFLDATEQLQATELDVATTENVNNNVKVAAMEKQVFQTQSDAPPCPECGEIMVRNAACYKCLNCGATNGCS